MAKQKFKITNWPTYNKALINRGSITFWLDDEAIQAWYESATPSSRGRPQRYSDLAITTVLVIKRVFRLTLRAAQGFIDSIFSLMNVPLRCPDYSCVSRRAKSVNISFKTPTRGEIAHLVIDSTGLKVFGEGEWKVNLTLLTILKLHMSIKESLMQRKCLICPPSAIYQPIQKLRVIFPDLLFIRKGQGVTPTAFAMHLYESITQGLESILGALDIEGSYDKQRTITIAPSPSVGAQVLPVIYRAIKTHYPQLLLRNPPIGGAENQLCQFQTDLITDNMFCTGP